MRERVLAAATFAAAVALLAAAPAARAEGWGTVKGQVVWAGGDAPEREKLKVDKDQGECLQHGELLSEKYVVDPKTKGVRWVMVWLVDPDKPRAPLPTHPALKEVAPKKIVLTQPGCQFQPHVLALREGQELEVLNPAKVAHNTKIDGGSQNPNINYIIVPGGSLEVKDFKASSIPVLVSCTIHGWMNGYIRVFNHPYFAVTDEHGNFEIKDAPAGKWNLVVWQEEKGWVTEGGKKGVPVEVRAGGTTDLGKIDLKP